MAIPQHLTKKNSMFRIIVFLLLTFVAFAASAKLQVTPDELQVIWAAIEDDIRTLQTTAENEIRRLAHMLRVLNRDAKIRFVIDMEEASRDYLEGIKEYDDTSDIATQCVFEANQELYVYSQSLTEEHFRRFDSLYDKTLEEMERLVQVTIAPLEDLDQYRQTVLECVEDGCASQLNLEIVEFYGTTMKQIDGAVEQATDTALVNFPMELSDQQLDRDSFEQTTNRLLSDIRECAKENRKSA